MVRCSGVTHTADDNWCLCLQLCGRACLAVAGPATRSVTLETGNADRAANMRLFGAELLRLLVGALEG